MGIHVPGERVGVSHEGSDVRQGAARHALIERGNDFIETPGCATEALIRTGELERFGDGWIWEPAAGRGAISAALKEAGFRVISEDLVRYDGAHCFVDPGLDFLLQTQRKCDAIVTNPPYKLGDQFIRHGLSLGLPVIVLLRLMAIEGAGRSDIMAQCRRIYAGIERLPFMRREGWTGPRHSNSGAPFGWFVFEPGDNRAGPIELRRISWRAE